MRVIQAATLDVGGAARAMLRLQKGLLDIGTDSRVLVAEKRSSLPYVEEWKGDMATLSRIQRRSRKAFLDWSIDRALRKKPEGFDFFSDDRSRFGSHTVSALNSADLVNLHWIARFVDVSKVFPKLKSPVVWTLHDEHAFTGGCHYDFGCRRWREGCGKCPQLGSEVNSDFSSKAWERKKESYRHIGKSLTIVTPSRWLGKMASESPLLGDQRIEVIPYGVPTEIYHPGAREGLRAAFRLERDDRALLFVSDRLSNRRKGFGVLEQALARLPVPKNGRLVVFSIGLGSRTEIGGFPLYHLGTLEREELVAAAFAAADFFVAPSLQDNLPNTVLESLACGTPVIGSNVGGIPDMVRPKETGWLFDGGDPESLKRTIESALTSSNLPEMRERCREVAVLEYSMEVQARKYRDLYEQILAK